MNAQDLYFVDIAAVRIQTWLARSAKVRYRRGASFRLADLTDPQHVATLLPPGGPVVANTAAGSLSGVASVCFPADGLSEEQAREMAMTAAIRVASALRDAFPALPLRAVWGSGPSYVQAYAGDMRLRPPLLDLPAQVEEGIAARPCGMCRSARAVHPKVSFVADEEGVDLCVDCHSRVMASDAPPAGFTSVGSGKSLPKAQLRLEKDLQTDGIESVFPKDFAKLASWLGRTDGDAATHLCTLFADGNRIGVLMKAIADQLSSASPKPGDPPALTRAEAVAQLTAATRRAVAEAALAAVAAVEAKATDQKPDDLTASRKRKVPALIHIADGDDVLMTVPAAAGWTAATTLATAFEREIGDLAARAGIDGTTLGSVSISMGMVFHHATHPFADVVGAAEEQLKTAKRQFLGGCSAVAFLDYTADGESSVGTVEADAGRARRAISLDELRNWSKAFAAAADVEASQRSNLLQLLRETTAVAHGTHSPPSHAAETPRVALARRIKTLARSEVLALVGGSDGGPIRGETSTAQRTRVQRALLDDDASARDELRFRLDIVRWWPPATAAPHTSDTLTPTSAETEVTP